MNRPRSSGVEADLLAEAAPIRVGVIGTGSIGTDHALALSRGVAGAAVSAVTDVNRRRATQVAAEIGGATVLASGEELIASDEVDAVLVTSIGETHAEFTLASIAAGKPVLCEKPLAPTTAECIGILQAEVAHGSRLVMVGFMRRFDPGYLAVKAALANGRIGAPLMLHNIHRNPAVGATFSSVMAITESMIHEFDITRWLLEDEIFAIQMIPPVRSPRAAAGVQDPQFAAMHTAGGILSTISFSANATYGYDVRCELVGSDGVASLTNPVIASTLLAGAAASPVPASWKDRFGPTYRAELQAWISGLHRGGTLGPSAWDGYAATRVAEAGIDAILTGERVTIDYVDRPGLYTPAPAAIG